MLGLLRAFLLWRIARRVVPIVMLVVLLAALTASIHHQPIIAPPRSIAPIAHDTTEMITKLRQHLTIFLERQR